MKLSRTLAVLCGLALACASHATSLIAPGTSQADSADFNAPAALFITPASGNAPGPPGVDFWLQHKNAGGGYNTVAVLNASNIGSFPPILTGGTFRVERQASSNTAGMDLEVPAAAAASSTQGTPASAANAWPVKPTDAGGVNQLAISAAGAAKVDGSAVTQPVSGTVTANLSTLGGAATAANQYVSGTAGTPSAQVVSVQGVGGATAIPVSNASLPLPTGAATSALQTTINTTLGTPMQNSGGSVTTTQSGTWANQLLDSGGTNKASVSAGGALKVDNSAVTQPVSAASLPLPAGAATSANQAAPGTAGTPSAQVISVQGLAGMTAVKTDPSAVTSPISAASLPLPAGAATSALQTTINTTLGSPMQNSGGSVTANVADTTASNTINTQNLNPNSGVATANSTVAIALNGQNTVSVQVVGTWTGVGGLSPQVTVDGTNWITLTSQSLVAVTGIPTVAIPSASQSTYQWNVAGWAQARITATGAVTGTATVSLRASMAASSIALSQQSVGLAASVAVVAGSSLSNDVGVQYRATSTGGALVSKVLTTASTNLTTPKGTAGRLIGWTLTNTALNSRFVHFYNNAAPTVGTTVPTFTIVIPTLQSIDFTAEGGIAMATAISYSITAAASATDLDATVTAANDVTGVIYYQ